MGLMDNNVNPFITYLLTACCGFQMYSSFFVFFFSFCKGFSNGTWGVATSYRNNELSDKFIQEHLGFSGSNRRRMCFLFLFLRIMVSDFKKG